MNDQWVVQHFTQGLKTNILKVYINIYKNIFKQGGQKSQDKQSNRKR